MVTERSSGSSPRRTSPVTVELQELTKNTSKKAPTFREEMNREMHIYSNDVKYVEEQKGK